MCDVTIKQAEQVIRGFNSVDKGEVLNDHELAELYADAYELNKEVEKYAEALKKILIERNIAQQNLIDKEKKVFLDEGRSSKVYNTEGIYNECQPKYRNEFFKVVNPVVSRVDDLALEAPQKGELKGIIEKHSEKVGGGLTVKIAKLTKKELTEVKGEAQ